MTKHNAYNEENIKNFMVELSLALTDKFGFTRMAVRYDIRPYKGQDELLVDWKTYRGQFEEDDTALPQNGFQPIASSIAARYGLKYVTWAPLEKGWGDFTFVPA